MGSSHLILFYSWKIAINSKDEGFLFLQSVCISINSVGSYLKNTICFCSFIDEQDMFHKHIHPQEETLPRCRENNSERKRDTPVSRG